jgi:serine/threonine protein kinase
MAKKKNDSTGTFRRSSHSLFPLNPAPAGTDCLGMIGDYLILQELGKGSMGTVFLATKAGETNRVALKIISPQLGAKAVNVDRFRREITALKSVKHPGIVEIYDDGTHTYHERKDAVFPYYVMKKIDGVTLKDYMSHRKSKVPSLHVCRIIAKIAEALICLESNRITHRDIKPSNIMIVGISKADPIPDNPQVVLLDLGVAYQQGELRLTETNQLVGTIAYMAPELLHSDEKAKSEPMPTSDQFSLGCVFYELLVGELPFPESLMARLQRFSTGKSVDFDKLSKSVPLIIFASIINRMLEIDVQDRYPSSLAVLHEIQTGLRRLEAQLPNLGPPTSSSANREMKLPKYYAWNPVVYGHYKNTLCFFTIKSKTTQRTHLEARITSVLDTHGYGSYRLYQVFGSVDFVLRIYVGQGKANELMTHLRLSIEELLDIEPYQITDFHHWYWSQPDNKINDKAVSIVHPKYFDTVQQHLEQGKPIGDLSERNPFDKSLNLMREVNPSERIIFFIFVDIQVSGKTPVLSRYFSELAKENEIANLAIYETAGGKTTAILKGECSNLFHAGALVTGLNEKLAMTTARTSTAVITDTQIVGLEKLTWRDTSQLLTIDPYVEQLFPDFPSHVAKYPTCRDLLNRSIPDLIPDTIRLSDGDVESLWNLIRTIRSDKPQSDPTFAENFFLAISFIFTRCERETRRPAKDLAERVMRVQKTTMQEIIAISLHSTRKKKAESVSTTNDLALGDMLDFVTYWLSKLTNGTASDKRTNWGTYVSLRNIGSHGKYDEQIDWKSLVVQMVEYISKYRALHDKLLAFLNNGASK